MRWLSDQHAEGVHCLRRSSGVLGPEGLTSGWSFARRMNKSIETIPADTMAALSRYSWPGNVRALENTIERAVILTTGPALRVPLLEFRDRAAVPSVGATTLEAAERETILRALHDTNWVIGGPKGAARRLGLKRTALQSRIQKLGIDRPTA